MCRHTTGGLWIGEDLERRSAVETVYIAQNQREIDFSGAARLDVALHRASGCVVCTP
jgi:hypothetical protein